MANASCILAIYSLDMLVWVFFYPANDWLLCITAAFASVCRVVRPPLASPFFPSSAISAIMASCVMPHREHSLSSEWGPPRRRDAMDIGDQFETGEVFGRIEPERERDADSVVADFGVRYWRDER